MTPHIALEAIIESHNASFSVAVIIPCYRVTDHILDVIERIGSEVNAIFIVDDCCPERSGELVSLHSRDPRVEVIRNSVNLGVGGAVMVGYRRAIQLGHDVLIKVDGDGQMPPEIINKFVKPIAEGRADYVKGNRFYDLSRIGNMPTVRLFGNSALSFFAKISTGYWNSFDPTNGYTAISAKVAAHLPFDKISPRYFFETDVLFRLNTLRAVVVDMPMHAIYADEKSNLKVTKVLPEFLAKHVRNISKRIFYSYFLRDMGIASLELLLGIVLLAFGLVFGTFHWIGSVSSGIVAPLGVVMFAVLPIVLGFQMILAFLAYDIANVPRTPIADLLPEPLGQATEH